MSAKGIDKICLVTFNLLFLLLCLGVGVYVYTDLRMEFKLEKEFEEIEKVLNKEKIDSKELNELLQNHETTGKYEEVEKAYKKYMMDYIEENNKVLEELKEIKVDLVLEVENISNDSSDEILKSYQEKITKIKKDLEKRKSDKTINSYYSKEGSKDYYHRYLRGQVKRVFKTRYTKNINNQIIKMENVLKQTSELLDFLKDNKENYQIEEDKIVFKKEELTDKYNQLYENWLQLHRPE